MPTVAEKIAELILTGRKVLFWIGAGTSCTAGIPPDRDDVRGLAYGLAMIHYGTPQAVQEQLGNAFRMEQLTARLGKQRVRDLLIQQGWMDLPPAVAHRAIAALVAEGFHIEIVTVNFDPLLENGLDKLGIEPKVIYSGAMVRVLAEDVTAVIKVHGCPFLDPNPDHLILLPNELAQPPMWVIHFLNGRLQERAFVYSGFSGNAEYVRDCISEVREALEGELNDAFAVDLDSAEIVFRNGNGLGEFYSRCQVVPANYAGGGADHLFQEVADLVFHGILHSALEEAVPHAAHHGPVAAQSLEEIISALSFEAVRAFAKRIYCLKRPLTLRVRKGDLVGAFKWMLILVSSGVLEAASFRPVLACPYHPGPNSSSVAPIVLFDGARKDALLCGDEIHELSKTAAFKREFQLMAVPKWFALVFNCPGLMDEDTSLDVIPRDDPNSTLNGYDPVICCDENSLIHHMQVNGLRSLESRFAS
jgi:SIR2-like domain